MIETSLDLLLLSLAIFGNLQKMFENVCLAFGTINLQKVVKNLKNIVKNVVISMFL